jgi:hypothetical protein
MFRVIYRGGDYIDVDNPGSPAWTVPAAIQQRLAIEPAWAVINLDILDGGDAYQALIRTLEDETLTGDWSTA